MQQDLPLVSKNLISLLKIDYLAKKGLDEMGVRSRSSSLSSNLENVGVSLKNGVSPGRNIVNRNTVSSDGNDVSRNRNTVLSDRNGVSRKHTSSHVSNTVPRIQNMPIKKIQPKHHASSTKPPQVLQKTKTTPKKQQIQKPQILKSPFIKKDRNPIIRIPDSLATENSLELLEFTCKYIFFFFS
jgi:hypothetical protein